MAEETAVVEQTQTTLPSGVEIITPGANMFSDDSWGTQPLAAVPPKSEDGGSAAEKTAAKPAVSTDEIVDEYEHLEKQTGYKTWDEIKNAKTELEQFKSKANTPAEIKFANEESKKLFEAWAEGKEDEVYSFFDNKRKLSKAADLPAADAIKLHLQQTNPHYKPEDVEDVFEERYSVPKKPVQGANEEPDEFNERMQEYTTRVAKVNRAIERDAVTAKQDLASRIKELVPPEIPRAQAAAQQPDPKVLEGIEAARNAFVQKLETTYNSFDSFNTKVKDESVELPIAFKADDKDKAEIKALVQEAVFKTLDVNDYFTNRWFTKEANGALTPNIPLMMEDFMLLEKREKVFQGIANNSAASRLAHQIKLNSNINVTGGKPPTEIKKDENTAMLDHFWKG